MGFSRKPGKASPFRPLAILFTFMALFHPARPSSSYTTVVYKGCSDQKFPEPAGVYTSNLKSLLSTLVSQAYSESYYNTTSGEGGYMLTGLYQCRGDLSPEQCGDCVSKIPSLAARLCGRSTAARIQLNGCYSRYGVAGFKQDANTEVLYKVCGKDRAGDSSGFSEKRDTALGMVENGVNDNGGFYTGTYGNVYVLGQCEGDVGSSGDEDCRSCVESAVERAKSECGDSISGQVYLSKCYISYSFYPNGVPALSPSSGRSGRSVHNTQKTVAVVLGGLAASGFVLVCLMFTRSLFKKRDTKYYEG